MRWSGPQLKNCDFRKILKIGSKTVTIEHSKMDLSDDERLQQVFCFVSWKGLMLGSLCPVERLRMIEAFMTSACLLWSYHLGFCHRCLKCHFIDNCFNVSEVSCLRNILWYFRILFPARVLFLLFKSQLKTKISANQKLWPIKTLPTVSNVFIAVHKVLQSVFET